MKLSRYNIEKKEDKSCLIYNTVTSAILELDTDYEKSYYEMKEGKKCSKPDLESALLEGGMLVEDDKDEFAELLIRNKIERFADSNLTLTIAPTMACNFCCPYCYEKGREYITMSETVQDQLTSQLKEKYQHIHELTVSWYGGEPLLAIETIEKLTKKIKSVLPLGCKYKPSNYGVCGAISLNSFVIGPDGALYKCWNDIGYSERSIGNLEKGIKLTNKFVEWLSYDVVKDQECKDCSFFPVCYGGCAAYKNKICSSVKWNAEEMLELMKEMAQ